MALRHLSACPLGAIWLSPPLSGRWTLERPDSAIVDGRRFLRARWKQPYPHVVEQYREDVERSSMHLMVLDDGTWRIEHVDDYNPDRGRAVQHFFADVGIGRVTKVAGVIGMLLGPALLGARRR